MHVPFCESVNKIASGAWGREFDSPDEAEKALAGDTQKLVAFGIVELLRRLNALAGDRPQRYYEPRNLKLPKNPKRFPNKQIGDKLFRGNLDEGFIECVIVAKMDDHLCITVCAWNSLEYPEVYIANDSMFATLEEAVRYAAEVDVNYYAPRLEYAEKALRALEAGEDIGPFMGGMPNGEE